MLRHPACVRLEPKAPRAQTEDTHDKSPFIGNLLKREGQRVGSSNMAVSTLLRTQKEDNQ